MGSVWPRSGLWRHAVYWGPQPAGFALGGVLAAAIGVRPTLFLSAAGATLVFLPLVLHPIHRLPVMPESDPEPIAPGGFPLPAPQRPDA
jgi:hypothetical protein